MMSWICSECGSECSPIEQDCPMCAGRLPLATRGIPLEIEESQADVAEVRAEHEAVSAVDDSVVRVEPDLGNVVDRAVAADEQKVDALEGAAAQALRSEVEPAVPVEPEAVFVAAEETIAEHSEPSAVLVEPEFSTERVAEDIPDAHAFGAEPEPDLASASAGAEEPVVLDSEVVAGESDLLSAVQPDLSTERVAGDIPDTHALGAEPEPELAAASAGADEPVAVAPDSEVVAGESELLSAVQPDLSPAPLAEDITDAHALGAELEPELAAASAVAPELESARAEPVVSEEIAAAPGLGEELGAIGPNSEERHLEHLSEALLTLAECSLSVATPEINAPPVQPHLLADRLSALKPSVSVPEQTAVPLDPAPRFAIPDGPPPDLPESLGKTPLPQLPPVYSKPPRPAGLPSWAITMVAAVVVTLIVASLVQKLSSSEPAASAAGPAFVKRVEAAAQHLPREAPEAITPETPPDVPVIVPTPVNEYPYARFVEVTSLKVVEQNNRPQVQYLVVNNAEHELNDIALRIAVRSSTAAKEATPLFVVAAWVPKLAPHQSKEIRTDLDTGLTAAQIPKPANLRTEVRVTSQQ